MGVVRKQSIFITGIIYIGFVLGAFNVLYLFPKYFTAEEFGLTRVLFAGASTFMQLASLGVPALMIKFFPYYNDRLDKKENDFLFLSLIIPIIGFAIISGLLFVFRDSAMALYEKKSPLFSQYFDLLFIFSFFYLIYRILETYASIIFKNVVPAFIREIGIRAFHLLLILLFVYAIIGFDWFIKAYVVSYFLGLLLLIAYIIYLKRWHIAASLSNVTRKIKKPVAGYGSFLYGGGILIILAENIDTMLIAGISGLQGTAVFAVASYISTIIQVPQKSMNTVVAPMVAQAWKNKDLEKIRTLYRKTAVTQLCISIFIFLCIWLNIDLLFSFLPPIYAEGKWIIFLMGTARIIDQGMGINGELLNTSKYWRVSFLADVILIACTIPLNYFLIKEFGIMGSAIANFIAYGIFNVFRFWFVWSRFGLQPFSPKQIWPLLLGAMVFFASGYLPVWDHILLSLLFNTLFVVIFFGILIIKLKVSEDINLFVNQLRSRFINR